MERMRRLAAIPLFCLAAAAPADPDAMRPSGAELTSALSLSDIQSCVTRFWARSGSAVAVPGDAGVAIDFHPQMAFAAPGKQLMTARITDDGTMRHLTVDYRHPMSAKTAKRALSEMGERCLNQRS